MKYFMICFAMWAAPAFAERVRHVPAADAAAGQALELVAIAAPTVPKLVVHYRTAGAQAFQVQELARRDDASWVAVVPAAHVAPPGLEYYLDAGGQPVFASSAAPHRTRVAAEASVERRARDDLRARGRRSRIHTLVEYIDFGKNDRRDTLDRYYRIDADFSYRLWAYPLDELRVGYTRLIGEKASTAMADCDGAQACNVDAGYKVAGWFELGLAPIEGVGVDGRMLVMATQTGFSVGGRGELRIGLRDGTHVATGIEYMADVGTNGFFRLGWATVPRTPMAATVEITKLPAEEADLGIRCYYDISRELSDAFRLGVRIGYAARDQELGGVTAGAQASLDL